MGIFDVGPKLFPTVRRIQHHTDVYFIKKKLIPFFLRQIIGIIFTVFSFFWEESINPNF